MIIYQKVITYFNNKFFKERTMSSYSKEATANLELDKTWERYLANSDDLSKILKNIELLAKTAKPQ